MCTGFVIKDLTVLLMYIQRYTDTQRHAHRPTHYTGSLETPVSLTACLRASGGNETKETVPQSHAAKAGR